MIIKYNNKVVTHNDKWIGYSGEPTPTLPPYTLRLKFNNGITPSYSKGTMIQVSSSPNVWDLTYNNTDWTGLCNKTNGVTSDIIEVLDANSSGVTNMVGMFVDQQYITNIALFDTSNVSKMGGMFKGCSSLTSVPLFDTHNVTNMFNVFNGCTSLTTVPLFDTSNVTMMHSICYNCTSLTTVPLFDTSKVTNMDFAFNRCPNVQSGALALYQQASTQSTIPSHTYTFSECGSNTQTGAAELAQIPDDWK